MFLAALLSACTDYDFHGGTIAKPGDSADTGRVDTGVWPPPQDSDSAPPDTDTGPPDTSSDVCYEPEDGYATNPAARIYTTDATTPVTLTFVSSDTDYSDELWIDSPESAMLATGDSSAPGTAMTLGPFAAGTELVFATQVENTGDHWQSGPGERNSDGVVHGAATYEGGCSWLIGFEDLNGGGDLDYNDIVMRVSGMLQQVD